MRTSQPELLLSRLDDIGMSLAQTSTALALIGLGSVGNDLDRLDRYSDLDFFVIAGKGHKNEFLDDLSWLRFVRPIAYAFRNTADGYKLLFDDDIFCEFAVFEEAELRQIPFAAGRIVWKREGVTDALRLPAKEARIGDKHDMEWSLGEALTNLYVGLNRFLRGERLSAMRFIQVYAIDRVLELHQTLVPASSTSRDIFAPERRLEQRHPDIVELLPTFAQGYERSPQSAQAILAYLADHFDVNEAIRSTILNLCAGAV